MLCGNIVLSQEAFPGSLAKAVSRFFWKEALQRRFRRDVLWEAGTPTHTIRFGKSCGPLPLNCKRLRRFVRSTHSSLQMIFLLAGGQDWCDQIQFFGIYRCRLKARSARGVFHSEIMVCIWWNPRKTVFNKTGASSGDSSCGRFFASNESSNRYLVTLDFPILFQPPTVAMLEEAAKWVPRNMSRWVLDCGWTSKPSLSGRKRYVLYSGSFFLCPVIKRPAIHSRVKMDCPSLLHRSWEGQTLYVAFHACRRGRPPPV